MPSGDNRYVDVRIFLEYKIPTIPPHHLHRHCRLCCFSTDVERSAAGHVLNCISWEAFGIVLSIVENPGGRLRDVDGDRDDATFSREELSTKPDVAGGSKSRMNAKVEGLAHTLLQVMAETVSAKELHLIALENLRDSYHPK